jgi:formate dehydrogenase major subunit/formate dehydrogenase alpha subunit
MTKLKINGKTIEVQEGTTVLSAAEKLGITIPTLCDHPHLEPLGGCRLCLVEVKGARTAQISCTLKATDGMEILTESDTLTRERREILQMLYASYFDAGYRGGQMAGTQFDRWIRHYGIQKASYGVSEPRLPVDSDPHPMIWVDMNKCIQCLRCVRACAEIQGRYVWEVDGRGHDGLISPGANGSKLLDARCESCGQCVAFCPTGALDNRMSMGLGEPEKRVTTTCSYCGVGCQFDLNIREGRIIGVTSNPNAPVNKMALCVKGRYGYDYVHHTDRVVKPKVRRYLLEGGTKQLEGRAWEWVDTEWEKALNIVSERLGAIHEANGADAIGVLTSAKCLNEENYLMNKFARQVLGTNNLDHCARL